MDRLNLKRRNAFYGDWWDEASQWRTGGVDRLCGGVPGSPSTEELADRGVRGTLFVHQLVTVRPGAVLDHLGRVIDEQVPLWREYDHEPTGVYEVLGNHHEAIVVWATSISGQARLRAARDAALGFETGVEADPRLLAWERRAAEVVTGGETQLMTPQPGTVYGPDDWEEASLDDWLHPEER